MKNILPISLLGLAFVLSYLAFFKGSFKVFKGKLS